MSLLIILLAGASAVAYLIAIVLIVMRRWRPYAGLRILNAGSVAMFALARIFPQSALTAMLASLVIAAGLFFLTRRSSVTGAALAAAPLLAMLLTVDRTFFSESTAAEFANATVAVLCAPGPIGLAAWLISLSRQTPSYPTTSSP